MGMVDQVQAAVTSVQTVRDQANAAATSGNLLSNFLSGQSGADAGLTQMQTDINAWSQAGSDAAEAYDAGNTGSVPSPYATWDAWTAKGQSLIEAARGYAAAVDDVQLSQIALGTVAAAGTAAKAVASVAATAAAAVGKTAAAAIKPLLLPILVVGSLIIGILIFVKKAEA